MLVKRQPPRRQRERKKKHLRITVRQSRAHRRQAGLDLSTARIRGGLAGEDGTGNLGDTAVGLVEAGLCRAGRVGVGNLAHGVLGIAQRAYDLETRHVACDAAQLAAVVVLLALLDGGGRHEGGEEGSDDDLGGEHFDCFG